MKYYIRSLLCSTEDELIGPFNTIERARAYKKKHNVFGVIIKMK